jgi:uncharacterized UBP type Zn finger protein
MNRINIIDRKVHRLTDLNAPEREVCSHLDEIQSVRPNSDVCEECIALGDTWVNLRLCMTCGNVGCCDDSKNQHASKHYHATGHPIIMSFQPNEEWLWCFVDNVAMN